MIVCRDAIYVNWLAVKQEVGKHEQAQQRVFQYRKAQHLLLPNPRVPHGGEQEAEVPSITYDRQQSDHVNELIKLPNVFPSDGVWTLHDVNQRVHLCPVQAKENKTSDPEEPWHDCSEADDHGEEGREVGEVLGVAHTWIGESVR